MEREIERDRSIWFPTGPLPDQDARSHNAQSSLDVGNGLDTSRAAKSSSTRPPWLPCGRPACGAFPAGVSSRGGSGSSSDFYFLRRDPFIYVRPPEAPIRAETKAGNLSIL